MYRKLAFLLAGLSMAGMAHADAIDVGQWYTFGFGNGGSPLGNGSSFILGQNPASLSAPNTPWTFTLDASGGSLLVTDGFLEGDQFELFDFGASLGVTSVWGQATNCSNDISACLADASISKGTFALGAGAHSITGSVFATINSGGAGFFIVRGLAAPTVPEPASWAMMIGGLATVGGFMRRRKAIVTFA